MNIPELVRDLDTTILSQRRSALLSITAIVFAVVLFLRCPIALLNASFWGEDGWVWYPDAYVMGVGSLLIPHTGYLQSFPRLIAIISQSFPLAWAPTIFACAALFVRLIPPMLLLSRRFDDELPSLSSRLLLSAVYICLPNSFETYLNVTNSQWHLSLVAFLIVTGRPADTRLGHLGDLSFLVLCCVSGPFCFMILPIAAWRWLASRSRHATNVLACVALLAALQGAVFLATGHSSRPSLALGVGVYNFVRIIAVQITLGLMIGARQTDTLISSSGLVAMPYMLLLASLFFVVCVAAIWKGAGLYRQFALYGALILFAALLTPVVSDREAPWIALGYPGASQRYFLIPMLVLVAAIFTLASARAKNFRIIGSSACALLLVGIVGDWSYPRMNTPNFNQQAHRFDQAPIGTTLAFQINPIGATPMSLTKRRR